MKILLNGQAPDASLALARGLHYGDGVFRTLLIWQGEPLDWALQWDKLSTDAAVLGLQAPSRALLEAELAQVTEGRAPQVLKIILSRQPSGRGYAPRGSDVDRLLICDAAPRYPAQHWEQGIQVQRSPTSLAAQPALAGIKHLNRLEQVLASRDWPAGCAESLMSTAQGQPVCGTRSNLFWVKAGVLYTPGLEQQGVAGLMRSKILALAGQLGWPLRIGLQDWAALEAADEAWVCNSLFGLWPLRALGSRVWPAPGPCALKLLAMLNHPRLLL